MENCQSSEYLIADTDETESDTESSSSTNSGPSLSLSSSELFFSADSEPSSPSPNSESSSRTHSESTESASFSFPDFARDSASSNLTFFGEYPSPDSGRTDDESYDQRDAVCADLGCSICYDVPPTSPSDDQSHDERESDALRAHLDCNICYDVPINPVTTYCGHIFCWPCLYHWLEDRAKPCPVCRTILKTGFNIVPIYCSTSGPSDLDSSALIPPRPNPPIFTRFPTQTQTLAGIDFLLSENQRLEVEQMQNCESMREHLEALTEELRALGSQIRVGCGSAPEGVLEWTQARIRELIVRAGDWLLESQEVRRLLDDIGAARGRLVRMRGFVQANRYHAGLWTSGVESDAETFQGFAYDY